MRLMRCTLCIGFHTRSRTSSAFLPFLSSRSTRTSQNITWTASAAYTGCSATQRHGFRLDWQVHMAMCWLSCVHHHMTCRRLAHAAVQGCKMSERIHCRPSSVQQRHRCLDCPVYRRLQQVPPGAHDATRPFPCTDPDGRRCMSSLRHAFLWPHLAVSRYRGEEVALFGAVGQLGDLAAVRHLHAGQPLEVRHHLGVAEMAITRQERRSLAHTGMHGAEQSRAQLPA